MKKYCLCKNAIYFNLKMSTYFKIKLSINDDFVDGEKCFKERCLGSYCESYNIYKLNHLKRILHNSLVLIYSILM